MKMKNGLRIMLHITMMSCMLLCALMAIDAQAAYVFPGGYRNPLGPEGGDLSIISSGTFNNDSYYAKYKQAHGGVDMYYHTGSEREKEPVYAIADGTVDYVRRVSDATNNDSVIHVIHVAADGTSFKATYGHTYALSGLKKGDTVTRGQQIGNTTYWNSYHLHFAVVWNRQKTPGVWGGLKASVLGSNTSTQERLEMLHTYGWWEPFEFLAAHPIAEAYTVPDGTFDDKISYLRNVLPEGWYWNNWSESDLGDNYELKNLIINGQKTTISTKPCAYHDSTTVRDSCNHYWEGLKGTQCCGYARMVFKFVWGYHTSSSNITDYAYPAALDYLDSVKPGDMIWNGSHYMFVIGVDGENIRVTHCNNDHKCVIQWDAIYTKTTIRNKMNANKKGYITVPNTRVDEPESEPDWVNYEVVYGSGLRIRASAGTSSTVIDVMSKGTVFKADMNRTTVANGYTWAYSQTEEGTKGWVAISNPDHCVMVTDKTWTLEYYISAILNCTQTTLKSEPYAASEDIRTMSGNEDIIVKAVYRNKYGNLWYELEEGGYVNEDNVTYVKSVATVQYDTNLYYENMIDAGSHFLIEGFMTSPTDSVWAVGVKIESTDGTELIVEALEFVETVSLDKPIDIGFVNDHLSMKGYSCLDEINQGEYKLVFIPYNYEEESMGSYTYFITINACDHKRYCNENTCILCNQTYSGSNIEHTFSIMSNEDMHWDLCVRCDFIAERSAHYRYCEDEVCVECGGAYENTEIYHWDIGYDGNENGHKEFCVVCGYTGNEGEHWRYCSKSVCEECGYSYEGQNVIHDNIVWEYNKSEHWYNCSGCGYSSEISEHYRFCDGEICLKCGADYDGSNIVHAYEEFIGDDSGHYWYCYYCNIATSEKTEHYRWCDEMICYGCLASYNGNNISHNEETVVDNAVAATCTTAGKTEGKHCSVCNEVLVAQTEIPALGHKEIATSAIPATHKTTGWTEGKSCERCGEVIAERTEIPVANVVKMHLPASLKAVKKHSFVNTAAECVIIPDGCERIEANAFSNNAFIRFVEIPVSVEFIDETAFENCPEDLIIVTTEGSFAHRYAQEKGILFVLVGK